MLKCSLIHWSLDKNRAKDQSRMSQIKSCAKQQIKIENCPRKGSLVRFQIFNKTLSTVTSQGDVQNLGSYLETIHCNCALITTKICSVIGNLQNAMFQSYVETLIHWINVKII